MSNPESTPTHLSWALGQPYAIVDFIPQSGTLDLASVLSVRWHPPSLINYFICRRQRSSLILVPNHTRNVKKYSIWRKKINQWRWTLSDPQYRARICKRLWSPGINSEEPTVCIPPAYAAWQACTTNRFVLPARQAGNRFLGSLKGLQIRAQYFPVDPWISHLKTTLPFFSSL
jgi:hypothetical protein